MVCVGPGGVGKTTTAAALALRGARAGLRACVVTIDPARRLADALGIGEVGNEPHGWRPPRASQMPGELWAVMLDAQTTFDDLVSRYATGPDQADAILANPVYRNISAALSGTQEYMAVEKLYELQESGAFDLIVVDTPPGPARARFPGSAQASYPPARQQGLPPAHDAHESGPAGAGDRCAADVADDRQGRRRSGRCRHDRLFHPVRRHGGGLQGSGTTRRRRCCIRSSPRSSWSARPGATP